MSHPHSINQHTQAPPIRRNPQRLPDRSRATPAPGPVGNRGRAYRRRSTHRGRHRLCGGTDRGPTGRHRPVLYRERLLVAGRRAVRETWPARLVPSSRSSANVAGRGSRISLTPQSRTGGACPRRTGISQASSAGRDSSRGEVPTPSFLRFGIVPSEFVGFAPHLTTLLVLSSADQKIRPPQRIGVPYRRSEAT